MTDRTYIDSDYGEARRIAASHRRRQQQRRAEQSASVVVLIATVWSPILALVCLLWFAASGKVGHLLLTGVFALTTLVGLAALYRRGVR